MIALFCGYHSFQSGHMSSVLGCKISSYVRFYYRSFFASLPRPFNTAGNSGACTTSVVSSDSCDDFHRVSLARVRAIASMYPEPPLCSISPLRPILPLLKSSNFLSNPLFYFLDSTSSSWLPPKITSHGSSTTTPPKTKARTGRAPTTGTKTSTGSTTAAKFTDGADVSRRLHRFPCLLKRIISGSMLRQDAVHSRARRRLLQVL
jgi:hypothetical protein